MSGRRRYYKSVMKANLIGLTHRNFLLPLGGLVLIGALMTGYVHVQRFCSDGEEKYCQKCPEHATCSGGEIRECDGGYFNNKFECLFTSLNEEDLRKWNIRIIRYYNQNISISADDLWAKHFERYAFEGKLDRDDFKAAIRFDHKYTISEDRLIRKNNFVVINRQRSSAFIGIFTTSLGIVWVVLFIIAIRNL